jgi:hypothetical protein
MTVIARDEFTYSAPPSSGAADFTATDNTAVLLYMDSTGSPVAGDKVEYTLTFPGGTVTIRARWSTTSTLLLERISTIAGTSNGTATLATITGSSTSKPRTDGDLVRIRITVNRGAVNALTAIGWGWAPRSSATESNSGTFNVDGELTPSAGAFLVSGTSFTNRPDLAGTTPDTVALGTWTKVLGTAIEQLGTESDGICRPQRTTSNEAVLALTGTGVGGDYTVRATVTFPPGEFPGLVLAGRVSGSFGSLAGYAAVIVAPDVADIGAYSGGVFTQSDTASITAMDDGSPHTLELVFAADVVTLVIDTVQILQMTGVTTLTGDPGLGAYRSDRTVAGIDITAWELDEGGAAPMPGCTELWSRHQFLGPESDVDGQRTDTYPGQGVWAAQPVSGAALQNYGMLGRIVGAGRAVYLDQTIPDLPADYCVQVTANHTPTYLPGDPGDPGTPGTDPYVEQWRYEVSNGSGTVYEDGLVSDLVVDNTFTYAGSTFLLEDLSLWANGQPRAWEFEHDAIATLYVRFYTTAHKTATGIHSYPATVTWEQAIDPEVIDPPGPALYQFGNYGALYQVAGSPIISANMALGPQNVGPAHDYPPFYYPDGQPATVTVSVSSSVAAPVLSFRLQADAFIGAFTSGHPAGRIRVIEWADVKLDGVTTFDVGGPPTPPGDPVIQPNIATVELLARADAADDTGYVFRQVFDFSDTGNFPVGTYQLEHRLAGVTTRLVPDQVDGDVDFATPAVMHLQVADTRIVASVDGLEIMAFDTATDDADETSAPVTDLPTGDPGLGGTDDSGTGSVLILTDFQVMSEDAVTIPCEGSDDNPYPHDPPPPVLPLPAFHYEKRNLLWRPVAAPVPGFQAGDIHTRQGLTARQASDFAVMKNRAWRFAGFLEQYPPPDTPLPPYYDPCELLDPGVDLPPVGDVDPVPATGTRYYGLAGMATTLLGAAFNGTQRALGSWTPTDLAQAAARSGVLLGGIGSYAQFRDGSGNYSPTLMDTFIETIAATIGAALLSYQTAGTFGAVIIADDFKVVKLWPPSGLSNTELARIAEKWATELPGIRLGLRIRPRAIGTPIAGIAVYVAQYDGPQQIPGRGIDNPPTVAELRAWRDAELDELESWAGSAVINIQPNYLKGGADSGSAYISTGTFTDGKPSMSPAEVIDCADAWFGDSGDGRSDLMWGSTGYLYHPDYMPITGMADAMATFRNGLMGLSPI